MLPDLLHNCRHTACIVEYLSRPAPCRTDIQQIVCAPVQPVKGISGNLNTKFMCQRRKMQQAVGAAGNGGMNQNRILKAVHRHNIARLHTRHRCKPHSLLSSPVRICLKVRAHCWHQGASRKRKAKRLCHNLHGRGCSDKRAGAAARAGVAFRPIQLLLINLPPLILRTVHAQLLKRQHLRACIHSSSRHYHCRNIHSGKPHQIRRHSLITAGKIHSAVKGRCICMDLNHIRYHFPACKAVINSVCPLALAVTDICSKISCSIAARGRHALSYLFYQFIQMSASRMAVAKCTFNHNLRFRQILRFPSGPDTERIKLRRKLTHFLTN